MLPPIERRLVLERWNATDAPFPATRCTHQVFEEQARRTPDAVALVHGTQTLTFAETNTLANRISHRLIAQGVRPGDHVLTVLERGVPLVASQLAILKAGAAYVPINTQTPVERQAWIVADCAAALVLTDDGAAIPGTTSATIAVSTLMAPGLDTDPDLALSSESAAYAMYTSGSTGTPKGVLIPHRAINRLAINSTFAQYGPGDRMAFCSNPAFDANTLETWPALLNGAAVVIVDQAALLSAQLFRDTLEATGVNTIWLTVGLFNQIAATLAPIFPRFRTVMVGGDALDPLKITEVLRGTPPQRLINGYGPTETTVFAAVHPIVSVDTGRAIPIGRPVANTRIYLLDAFGQPVPIGAPGEICIGGPGVGLGYLNRPELTAERFVHDPFSPVPGARMYRSGDLARYRADGNIEFLGRNDQQVKIRGFRVEPGEIEARLTEHPDVETAAVIVREDTPGDRALVAYLTATPHAQVTTLASRLRTHLAGSLPDYMVPSAYVRLDTLPLTPNGKLDRRALPAPEDSAFARQAYEPPQGDVETTLASLWEPLLNVERVGRFDNFFALGGHSLLVMRLNSLLHRELGVTFPASTLFSHPTLAAFAAQIDSMERSGLPPIEPVARDTLLLPSFAQQRLWFLAQLEGQETTYHVPIALRMHGALDRAALRYSLNHLVARHEALRATFLAHHGQPRVRLLAPDTGLPLLEHDLRYQLDKAGQLWQLAQEEAHARFDLTAAPPIRARLIQMDEAHHVLLLTLHHIATDGWSMNLIFRDLSRLYSAHHGTTCDSLSSLRVQYFDYAAWQHRWLTGAHLQAQLDYWRDMLRDAPQTLQLQTDRSRPAQQSFEGAALQVRIDAKVTRELTQLARRYDCTLFVVVLAAWAVVLSRLSGQDDLVIGTPTANRRDLDIEPLIGFFVNTLPLRIDLSDRPDCATLLAHIRDITLAAQEHADVPFEQIVEIAQPIRRADCTPVFQVIFAWQSNEVGRLELPGMHIEEIDTGYEVAKFDLELDLAEDADGISGHLRYATALFDTATIERYRGYLLAVLNAMIADHTQPLARVSLLSDAERTLQLETWNATDAPFPATRCTHQVFEEQARRTPDAVALVHGTQTLTFAETNTLANRISHRLIAQGVRPGDHVLTVLERGVPLVASQLAILKAGAAYVPINTQTPVERQAWIVADCAAALVLTDDGAAIPGTTSATIAVSTLMAPGLDTDPDLALSSESAAYAMYTSGSTGTPKGVLIPHRAINRLAINSTFAQYGPGDRMAFCSNPAFDANTLETWPALLNGAAVVIVDQAALLSAQLFRDTLEATGVNTIWLTVGLFNQIAATLAPIFPRFRTVMVGGDALDPLKITEVLRGTPPQRLINGYGPTETTVFAAVHPIVSVDTGRAIPIGRPVANTRIYLLDAFGQPVPIGAPGEICIGGPGVGLGYLNRPELTAERFVHDPFSPVPGARMYRSGDLARYRADGNIEFLGRNDQQVKIRGFRVEPGEIEARLTEHPDVETAAVIVREDTPGDRALVAYLTATPHAQVTTLASRLRTHLAGSLPDYMVPSAYVRLDTLPLTPNGKLDRRALPAPEDSAFARQAYEPPQGDVETTLASLWEPLLNVERVGRFDNFFALGGHSLLAVKIVSDIRKRFQSNLTIETFFNAPTIAQLGTIIGVPITDKSTLARFSTPIPRIARQRRL
ncbi:amino acid adenylation domain-containing protein [Paraburkholderia sp. GAS41]|uniref:amino acid adenylation domain-containing protein n=1 Tax=Paraburkholderia sp. GAS41 TaxID=3035134 RepID=UPI003D1E437B